MEPRLDGLSGRHGVVRDGRPEHGQATLLDEFAIGVNDRLGRALREPLDLAEDDLDRTVQDSTLMRLPKDQLEGRVRSSRFSSGYPLGRRKSNRYPSLIGSAWLSYDTGVSSSWRALRHDVECFRDCLSLNLLLNKILLTSESCCSGTPL